MNIHLATLGCRLNDAENARWTRGLQAAGHQVVARPEAAHIMVLNTCAVTAEAARKSRQAARRLHRRNPQAKLVLTGCFSELEPEVAASLTGVDLVVPNREKDDLVEVILQRIIPHTMPELATEPANAHVYAQTHTRAFVKVQDGCSNQCAFCIVTVARGEERSRPLDEVVRDIQAISDEGPREIVITGVHLGGYGRDLGLTLRDLVAAILERTDVGRLRLSSLEPWDIPDGFWELWQDPRLCPHLHLPLQSGSDSVLRRMARRCFTDSYQQLVADARAAIPGLAVTTDIIVGYPGETDAEWEETKAFVEQVGFAHMHIFTYSPRPGTRAATLPDRVDADVQRVRSREAHAIASAMKERALRDNVGDTRDVLWEGRGQLLEDGGMVWRGYTDNYLRVEASVRPGEGDANLANRITPTALQGVVDGERLVGRVMLAL